MNRFPLGSVFACSILVLFASPQMMAQEVHSEPRVHVIENTAENGWQVKVSFANAPSSFGRAGHAWTLERAKEMAEEIRRQHNHVDKDVAVAEIRIEGKNGDGMIRSDQGPHLPDWPIVEQQFRAFSKAESKDLDNALAQLKNSYEQAAQTTEQVLREGEALPTQKEQALRDHYEKYNQQANEMDRVFFGDRPAPLPRLQLPDAKNLLENAKEWPISKRMQFESEQLAQQVRQQKSDLDSFRESVNQKRVEFDKARRKGEGAANQRSQRELQQAESLYKEKSKSQGERQNTLELIQSAVGQRLNAVADLVVDASRIAPPADGFAAEPGGAAYRSAPRIEVRKTDDNGNDLPDDKQPQGYPKPFVKGMALGIGEKVFVDPSLRVELLAKKSGKNSGEVRAGVYGPVTSVDEAAGKVAIQADEEGTQLLIMGVQPQGIRVGDYLEPQRIIGTLKPPSRWSTRPQLVIRAVNPKGQLIPPGPVLDFVRRPPTTQGTLARDTSPPDSQPLPVKQSDADDAGKPEDQARVVFDDTAEKGASFKQGLLEARELLARREMQDAQEAESRKATEAGELASKARQVDMDLASADDKLRSIDSAALTVHDKIRKREERKKQLQQEVTYLTNNKKTLEGLAARANASQSSRDIDDYNVKANEHNRRYEALRAAAVAIDQEETAAQAKLDELQRDKIRQQKKKSELASELRDLEPKATAAKSELEQARVDLETKKKAIQEIADEKQRLSEDLRPASKAPAPNKAAAQTK